MHSAIGGAYRSQRITTLELRFNPMKRNRGGERDLDHIILAAVRGLDLARLEYPQVRCGLILMMDRTFEPRQNEIVVEKAIRWASRGVVGVDIAGPRPGGGRYDYTQIKPMVETARAAGLGVTIHVGEEGETGAEELGEVIEHLRPDRIGHGILAAHDPELMRLLREAGTVLEICPTSNLLTKALADEDAVRDTFRAFVENGVAFTIATDGPEMMHTHLRDELELLERIGALTREELEAGEPARPRGELHSPLAESPAGGVRCVREMAVRWKLLIALWTVYLVWGSTYVAIKISVRTLPRVPLRGLRFLLAGVVLALILSLRGRSIRVTRRELVVRAARHRAARAWRRRRDPRRDADRLEHGRDDRRLGAAAGDPAAHPGARERVALATKLSVLVGLAGLALIVLPGVEGASSAIGLALMVGSTVSWSLGSFFAHRLPLPGDGFVATTWQMLCAALFLLVLGAATGEVGDVDPGRLQPRVRRRLALPRPRRDADRLHRVHLAASECADLEGRHAPVREPARRDRARRRSARRADHCRPPASAPR